MRVANIYATIMSLIDSIILIIVVVGLVLGYIKGLVKQLSTICGIVLGVVACHLWGDWATRVLVEIVPESATWPAPEYTTGIIANIILFLIIFLGIKIIGAMFKSALEKLHLGLLDKMAGALFCTFKYLLVVSIVLNVAYVIAPDNTILSRNAGNKPLQLTMDLAPSLLGVGTLPELIDDLNKSLKEN